MWNKYVEISIKEFSLWDENARFSEEYFKKTETELITYFLSDKKFEIEKLAKEIVQDFYEVPQFEEICVYMTGDKKIVFEGNRRLTVYKLLCNPLLAAEHRTQAFFKELKAQINIDENFTLYTHVTNDKEEAYRYLDRKHNKRNNEVSWTGTERGHFAVRSNKGINKDVFKVEMTREMKMLDLPNEIRSAVLGKGYETTFWRIVENPSIRKKLGYEISSNGELKIDNKEKFSDVLKVITYNIWNKESFDGSKINSRNLNKSEQIAEYSEKLFKDDANKVNLEIKKIREENRDLLGEKITLKQKNEKNIYGYKDIIFESLIDPKKKSPKVASEKIREVFKELTIINVENCTTATFALVRILIDISVKNFLELKNYHFNANGDLIIQDKQEKNKTTLKGKVDYIAKLYLDGDLKKCVVALNEELLTQNLNQVMHNTIFLAAEKQIRDFWRNLFPFLEFLWEEIIKVECK